MLDSITILQINLQATREAVKRLGDNTVRDRPLGELMVDDDYRAAIREYFSDCADLWEDWMVEPLLKEVKDHNAFTESLTSLAETLCQSATFFRLRR